MEILILVIHVVAALVLVGVVLLQHGKGADVGAAFGSGASGSLFGAAGSANFLSRTTAILAIVFFLTSLGLTYFSGRKSEQKGILAAPVQEKSLPDQVPPAAPTGKDAPSTSSAPAAPADPGSRAREVPK